MRYIFYADVYFIQNFMMKVAALYLALCCGRMRFEATRAKVLVKIGIVSLIGTLFEIVGLIFSGSYSVFVLAVYLLEIPFMTWIVLGKNRIQTVRVMIAGYFFTIIINGVLEALWNQFGEHGSYVFYLLFSCGVVIVGMRIWLNYTKMQKGIFQVEVLHQGKRTIVNAFYDSGNRLKDPYTQRGVHIVSLNVLRRLDQSIPVYIPYQSLGNEAGLLEVYYIDELIIEGEKGRIIIQNCPVGVTKDNLFEGKKYEMILNEEVF